MKLKTIVFIALALPCLAFGSSESDSKSESSESSEETRADSKTCTAPHEIYIRYSQKCTLNCHNWSEWIRDVDRTFDRCLNPCHCEDGYIRREKDGPCIPIMECEPFRNADEYEILDMDE
ncbi:uncharacterized protein LOC115266810 [Aedes albopictus]|uniref:TIL domain-containing protein n=1 Tax=Aedes albopictus TaxID=7160 RepID=A0ABM1Z346_AEDAL|nr:hypothetical protein RP20_CCG009378 [Aedes albopictus]